MEFDFEKQFIILQCKYVNFQFIHISQNLLILILDSYFQTFVYQFFHILHSIQ